MPNEQFYSNLTSFDEFSGVAELDQYRALPDDWVILTSDVVGSTIAIEAGKYKQVNMVGAASIMCVLNICEGVEVPFSFGGDGGLIAVPASIAGKAKKELRKLQAGCGQMFGLELRASAIEVGELRAAGGEIAVRKFQLNDDNHLAMFAGSGTALADEWMKSDHPDYEKYKLSGDNVELPDLEGLSCRWEPLRNINGVMLTLIVKPSGAAKVDIAGEIAKVLKKPLSSFTPVKEKSLKFRFPPRGLAVEVAAGAKRGNWIMRYCGGLFTSSMQWLCEKFKIKIGDYDGSRYRDELIGSTDFRKYDGALRMVLDVSINQAETLEKWLEAEYRENRLLFGTWRSASALMTCMLFDLTKARHLHLVDGADGGYALAAKEYKRRAKRLS
ncbi:MAG: DUF3095 domain-containing protein [Rhizobiaceae bacterium]|nr:DUF3095 domain-containing protein [Rhizobiaceae bacterium]